MTIQNARGYRFRGEDLGTFGTGNTREVTVTNTVTAAGRPLITTMAYTGGSVSAAIIGTPTVAVTGLNRVIVNRSPKFYMTLTATINPSASGQGAQTVQIPIAPLQSFFLPVTMNATGATMAFNSTWPIPGPLNPAANFSTPTPATTTQTLTFDYIQES